MGSIGTEIHSLIARLYPICRSITGDGVRETLKILREYVPLDIQEVPTGTRVFDWVVPKEWNIRDAYVKDSGGKKTIDFKNSNLHVLNYSIPVRKKVSLAELKEHLFTLPDFPDWIPYRTSYYKDNWGFCIPHKQYIELQEDEYELVIDSSLEDGHLTLGELYLEGESSDEIVFYSHTCHPSLCNDNLSGVALATLLAKYLSDLPRRHSYRFLFAPGTIGAITWLCLNEDKVSNIKHGLILACVGDSGKITYKKTRRGQAEIDKAAAHVLKHSGADYEIMEFSPYGYDERQFCSPGFNLPVGCFMRTPHGRFPEYHTSADNLDFVRPEFLEDSFSKCLSILRTLEGDRTYLNLNSKCEPYLGKRGLYKSIGGQADGRTKELALLWVLNLSDGNHSLLDIANRSGLDFDSIKAAADALLENGLLKEIPVENPVASDCSR